MRGEANGQFLSAELIETSVEFGREYGPKIAAGLGVVALGLAEGYIPVIVTTIDKHRRLTHGSLELPPLLQKLASYERSTPPGVWAAVHLLHHEFPDATLYPQYKIEQYLRAREANPAKYADHPPIPEKFKNLDPFAIFALDEVRQIGSFAIDRIKDRVGERYTEPSEFSHAEAAALLDTSDPRYYYHYKDERPEKPYSTDEVARILLTDPHSPALVPPVDGKINGIKGIAKGNVGFYRVAADLFKAEPDLIPLHIREQVGNKVPLTWPVITAIFAGNIALMAVLQRGVSPEKLTKAALYGGTTGGVAIGTLIFGGNTTNSYGHGGRFEGVGRMLKAGYGKEYEIKPNADGTLSTDTTHAGWLGRLFSWFSFDEVGGQDHHHHFPGDIAYTLSKGIKKWRDAPWGSSLEYLAHNKWFWPLKLGKGFKSEDRPDVPNEAVRLVHAARVRTMAA